MSREPLAEQLSRLWRQGERPVLVSFLAGHASLPLDELVGVLHVDQCQRWRANERVPAEAYLAAHPELEADLELAVELVYGEYLIREEAGEKAALEEFQSRFPRLAERLGQQIRLHLALGTVPPFGATLIEVQPNTAPALPSRNARLGRRFGKYLLNRRIGAGGMGVVYEAQDTVLQRSVAIKFLPDATAADPEALRRFLREGRSVARLDHPNVVRALDLCEVGGTHFLVMEYIDGIDAEGYLARHGAMPVAAACEVARQAALGLQHAHERGLVHRDIKPSNLMLASPPADSPDAFPLVKILDLGLARRHHLAPNASTALTAMGTVMGTLDYIAPEQSTDSRTADARSDLYSLGCTLYHLLAGRVPFDGDSVGLKLVQHHMSEPPPLVDRCPEIPPGVVRLVRQLMAKNPQERPASAAEVAAELDRLLGRGLTSGRSFGAPTGDEDDIVRAVSCWRGRTHSWRRPALAGALALALFAFGAVVLWVVWLRTS